MICPRPRRRHADRPMPTEEGQRGGRGEQTRSRLDPLLAASAAGAASGLAAADHGQTVAVVAAAVAVAVAVGVAVVVIAVVVAVAAVVLIAAVVAIAGTVVVAILAAGHIALAAISAATSAGRDGLGGLMSPRWCRRREAPCGPRAPQPTPTPTPTPAWRFGPPPPPSGPAGGSGDGR